MFDRLTWTVMGFGADMRLGEKGENEKDRTKLYEMDARYEREGAGVFSERGTTEGKSLE